MKHNDKCNINLFVELIVSINQRKQRFQCGSWMPRWRREGGEGKEGGVDQKGREDKCVQSILYWLYICKP